MILLLLQNLTRKTSIALMRERSDGSNNPSLIRDTMPLSIFRPTFIGNKPSVKTVIEGLWIKLVCVFFTIYDFILKILVTEYSSACVMTSSELSGPFFSTWVSSNASWLLNSLQSSLRFETDVIRISSLSETLLSFEDFACFSTCIASGFFFWLQEPWDLPDVEAVDWSDMAYGVVYPGFVRHSSSFSSTWETNGDQSLLVHLYDRAK